MKGTFSERMAMVIIVEVGIITWTMVIGALLLAYLGKATPEAIYMGIGGGLTGLYTALKTSPDDSKRTNPGAAAENVGTLNVHTQPAPDESDVTTPPRRGVNGP